METVLSQQRPQRLHALGGDPAGAGLAPSHPPIESLLAVPIASLSQSYGWLYLGDKLGADQFSDIDEEVLMAVAAQIAIAYENLILFERIRLNLAQLERDSIERQRMAVQLQQSETQFRQLAENINEVFFLMDASNGEILYISPAYERIWDRTCASLYADPMSWASSIHPDDRDRILGYEAERNDPSNKGEPGFDYHYRVMRPGGGVRFIHARGFPIRNEEGEVYRIAGIAEDITAYTRAMEELRESERRYSDMLANVELLSMMIDCQARITYCNDFLLRVTGWERHEVLGRDFFAMFLPPLIREELQSVLTALLNCVPVASHHQNEILTRDGQRRLIQWNNSVLRSPEGDVIGVASIGEDITEQAKLREVLREREAGLQRAQQISRLAHAITGPNGEFESWSETLAVLLGVDNAGIPRTARDWFRFVHPSDLAGFKSCCIKAGKSGMHQEAEYRVRHADQSWIQLHHVLEPLSSGSGTAGSKVRWFNTIQDITEQKEQQQKLARLSRIYAVQSGINSAIVRIHEHEPLLQEACRVAVTQGRFSMAWVGVTAVHTEDDRFIHWLGEPRGGEDDIQLIQVVAVAGSGHPACRAARERRTVVCNDVTHEPALAAMSASLRERGHCSMAALPLIVADRVVAVITLCASEIGFFDMEEQNLLDELAADLSFGLAYIEKEERLKFMSYFDALTGLPNRMLFHDRLTQWLNGREQTQGIVCVVIINLDRFGHLNDALGRHAGDAVLRMVADRLTAGLTESHNLARIGGDTFAIMLTGLQQGAVAAVQVEQSIFDPLDQSFLLDSQELHISSRAGMALYPDDGTDADTLLKHAEQALRKVRSSGTRSLYYAPQMNVASAARLSLENDLRSALEGQQFVLHYQPRVDLTSGRIVSAEALIRWQHPQRGLVPPAQFIPLCEETGLIVPIGAWVIQAVCAQQAAWRSEAVNIVPVAVNLSALQFKKGQLMQTIAQATGVHGLEQKYLEFELTESIMMDNPEQAIEHLQALKMIGAEISLDDFGTGYSSLAYLQRFPFDFVKIDRSFVTHITGNPGDAAIVNAVIAMAHSLNLQVVAEGVETEGQLRYLRKQRCDQLQGYFFSPPLPASEFCALIREDKRLMFTPEPAEQEDTLLIVDDEHSNLSALNRLLRKEGYRVLKAGSGQEALELLALNAVQVVVSDQRMPQMSGSEFLSIVRELYPDIIRIILSGYTDLNAVTDSVNRGAVFRFLTKPWDDDLLRGHIREAFQFYRSHMVAGD